MWHTLTPTAKSYYSWLNQRVGIISCHLKIGEKPIIVHDLIPTIIINVQAMLDVGMLAVGGFV